MAQIFGHDSTVGISRSEYDQRAFRGHPIRVNGPLRVGHSTRYSARLDLGQIGRTVCTSLEPCLSQAVQVRFNTHREAATFWALRIGGEIGAR
jgi:hypothetical protein